MVEEVVVCMAEVEVVMGEDVEEDTKERDELKHVNFMSPYRFFLKSNPVLIS